MITTLGLASFTTTQAQNVYIPDAKFKSTLLNDLRINTNLDKEIQKSEAIAYTGSIIVKSLGILDLKGIEAFTSIDSLDCYNNKLTSLNVSNNKALTYLNCVYNQLTSLDVSSNTALTHLECVYKKLTSLDVSSNKALTYLSCANNQLTNLNVSNATALSELYCSINQLKSLYVSSNMALT